MSVIAAAVLSSSALGQTVSSGTSPSPELPSVSTETAAAAPSVSTTSVATTPSISTETLTVSTTGQPLPGLATGYAAPTVSTAAPVEPASGVVPRPWVIGDIKADGLQNTKLSTIRGAIKGRKKLVLVNADAYLIYYLNRFFPGLSETVVSAGYRMLVATGVVEE